MQMTETQKKTVGTAIASLVLGILGMILGPLCSIPAVVCGHIAKSNIKRNEEQLDGGGLALAGLVLGYIQIGFMIFMIPWLIAVGVPSYEHAKEQATTQATQNTIHIISVALEQYELDNGTYPESLDRLVSEGYIQQKPVDAWGSPFVYEPSVRPPAVSSPGSDRISGTDDDLRF
jgi:competence protein ComGC